MSKIDDALSKAAAEGARSLVPSYGADMSVSSTSSSRVLAPIQSKKGDIALMLEPKLLTPSELEKRRIIHPHTRNRVIIDSFRKLRTKLLRETDGGNLTIMVTSVRPGGGGSFTALNLATVFSFDKAKTALLIDCNLQSSILMEVLRIQSEVGLIDYLEDDDVSMDEIIQPSGIQRLRWMPAGAHREITQEYYSSVKMRVMMKALKERYGDRYIIVDAPPVTEAADTSILAEFCDYILLVVPYGKVTERQIEEAAKAFGDSKKLGVVFNNSPDYLRAG
ncbi:MAG: polysaccharide biosynthesis protein [Deltaproteobacteria bacterium]|nr:polysaccharide biosynthesis protein [Deltaproteobacteria bacterium]